MHYWMCLERTLDGVGGAPSQASHMTSARALQRLSNVCEEAMALLRVSRTAGLVLDEHGEAA